MGEKGTFEKETGEFLLWERISSRLFPSTSIYHFSNKVISGEINHHIKNSFIGVKQYCH